MTFFPSGLGAIKVLHFTVRSEDGVSRILSQADVDEGQLLQNRVKKRESSYANEIFRCEDGETKQWLCLN